MEFKMALWTVFREELRSVSLMVIRYQTLTKAKETQKRCLGRRAPRVSKAFWTFSILVVLPTRDDFTKTNLVVSCIAVQLVLSRRLACFTWM